MKKTAEEFLGKAYHKIIINQSSAHLDVDPVLLGIMKEYAQQVAQQALKDAANNLQDSFTALTYYEQEYNRIISTPILTP